MPGIHAPSDDSELPSIEPHDIRDQDEPAPEADDREHRVVRQPNPLPSREEDEEELAEADILEYLDLEYLDEDDRLDRDDLGRDDLARDDLARDDLARDDLARDDLARMEGPDA